MKKIIVLCQVFYPDTTSTSQLFQILLQRLATTGWDINVLCGFPTETSSHRISRKEIWNGISIRRCGLRIPLKKNFLYRSASYLTFLADVTFHLLISPREYKWLGVTNPPFNAQVLALASWIRRHDFHYFFHDLYPEGLVALGELSHRSLLVRLWLTLNRKAYKKATRLFVLGRDMIPLLEKNYQLAANLMVYIPHWSAVEPPAPLPIGESRFVVDWALEDKFIVQYSGNMGLWHDMDSLVRTAHSLQSDKDFQFVFIGNGIRKSASVKLAKELGVKNIIWKNFCPLNDLSESLATCHVSLISLQRGLDGIAVPCKLYGILASGRAVVAQVPASSEIALTIKENGCGIVVEPGNDHQLKQTLIDLKNDPSKTEKIGTNAFSAYQHNYTVPSAAARLENHLVE